MLEASKRRADGKDQGGGRARDAYGHQQPECRQQIDNRHARECEVRNKEPRAGVRSHHEGSQKLRQPIISARARGKGRRSPSVSGYHLKVDTTINVYNLSRVQVFFTLHTRMPPKHIFDQIFWLVVYLSLIIMFTYFQN